MNQRPKLTLATSNDFSKMQAKGFEVKPEPAEKAGRKSTTPEQIQEPFSEGSPASSRIHSKQPQPDRSQQWPNREQLIGILLVAAAAAFSIYLLRR